MEATQAIAIARQHLLAEPPGDDGRNSPRSLCNRPWVVLGHQLDLPQVSGVQRPR